MYKALTIAGSDSGGGAGIQADLKTFQERNVFGMSAITALTAQNTLGVHHVFPQTVEAVQSQLDAVLSDIGADAVKTGMLFSSEIILAVSEKIRDYNVSNLVIDPVMIAKGGASLLQNEAKLAMKEKLFPLGAVITPNLPEAAELLNCNAITSIKGMEEAAKTLHESGAKAVLIKGGHMTSNTAVDVLYLNDRFYHYESERIETKHTHGTGCTYSACIAAELAKGRPIPEAVAIAKEYITAAITHALPIGKGIGPTNHAAYRQTQTSIMKT
ncbi:bifunctional hydroxymethylpyrimidine kinase/phosphomethylpyrimidine kinase [Bacillus sp. es.036]|uniref:bifunctional hydroxymethylpyrimidine kinase/phosphomethylpyrimidine kinase n=1 Tax=Bacillus sp. es.036 TaxID=1761764 RepID=UPI000BF54C40|nr:bifunctional hydroxymethylpyrimidine kinase/phosphomethylpyrimidine kinase [Bacillus sp. es.036]PFG13886.1 hydroxymethylpyrimidine/phosphomethylpyrimidine kinase [Bacillus sp. es.036]